MTTECKSCVGCKWLYSQGSGYSNYTWTDTFIHCAQHKNPHLEAGDAEGCYDWNQDPERDNWDKTSRSRCELYAPGEMINLDVDGEDDLRQHDVEALRLALTQARRHLNGTVTYSAWYLCRHGNGYLLHGYHNDTLLLFDSVEAARAYVLLTDPDADLKEDWT